jgi:hypothetical protein
VSRLRRLNPFRLSYLFRILIALATACGAVLVTTGTLAVAASLYGMMPFAFVAQLQVPYVGAYVAQYLTVVEGPVTQYVVAQVLASGVLGLAGAGVAVLLGLWLLRRVVMWVCRGVVAGVVGVVRSPVKTYHGIVRGRNWLLAKVAYLQSESQKWRTAFTIIKAPYSLLRAFGLSPQMATTLLFAGSAVGTGVVVNETVLSGRSFERGDPGIYLAPGDAPVSYISDPEAEGYNTLRIDLGTTPVRSITIENVSVGTIFTGSALPSGEQNVVQIGGTVISGGTNTRLEVGHLIFEKSRCKKLTLSDIQAHTLVVRGNASDGQSIAPSPGTSRMRAIGGGHHQADAMLHSGGLFDRILIQAPTSAVNGKIDKLTLSNLYTSGGECVLSRITAGTVEILYNEVGQGNGFATKEFVISTNVTGAVITVADNVEVTISEPSPS